MRYIVNGTLKLADGTVLHAVNGCEGHTMTGVVYCVSPDIADHVCKILNILEAANEERRAPITV